MADEIRPLTAEEVEALRQAGAFENASGSAGFYSGFAPRVEMRNGNIELIHNPRTRSDGSFDPGIYTRAYDRLSVDRSEGLHDARTVDQVAEGIWQISDRELNGRISLHWADGANGEIVAYVNSTGATSYFRRVELQEIMDSPEITHVTTPVVINGIYETRELRTMEKDEWYYQQRAQWAESFSEQIGIDQRRVNEAERNRLILGDTSTVAPNQYTVGDFSMELVQTYRNIAAGETSPDYIHRDNEITLQARLLQAYHDLPSGAYRDAVTARILQEFPEGDPLRAQVQANLSVPCTVTGVHLSSPDISVALPSSVCEPQRIGYNSGVNPL